MSKAVFISYASQDADAARRICDALRGAGVEVWFDQSELRGGDSWDQNIRKQIRECALFMPVISANTQARREGYFRIEWKLAVKRTDALAKGTPFLVPIVIDDIRDNEALVPEEFCEVQWTRLPRGEPSAAFCTRVATLLGGPERETARARTADHAPRPVSIARRPKVVVATAMCVAATLVLALWATGVFNPKLNTQNSKPIAAAPSPSAPIRPAMSASNRSNGSEARQLALKADALFDQDEYAPRENLVLAERFCQQATTLDPNDAEVWAIFSRVYSQYIFLTYDRSAERRTQAGDAATRAVRLAPQSFEARYAQAYFYRLDEASYPEAERMLRALLVEKPDDKRVWRTLGHTLRYATIFAAKSRGRDAEAAECFQRAAALPGGDVLSLHYLGTTLAALGRLDEGEAALNRAIAIKPRTATQVNRMNLQIRYRGDVARARAALGDVPVDWLREDYGAYLAAQTWLCSREPDKAINVLKALPRDYLEAVLDGPKGLIIGQAHRMAGRMQAAQIEWRAALDVVERRLTAQPNNTRLIVWKSLFTVLLGDVAEAKRLLEAAEQLGLSPRDSFAAANIPLEWGDAEKTLTFLAVALTERTILTRPFLRIDPAWDRLRGDPRFAALLAEPAAANGKTADKSIAVLAFANRSSEKESEYFSDGISEELLNVLAKVQGLKVVGRSSSFQFKGKNESPQEMGRKLSVTHLVEGSVQRSGSQARIIARLIRADTGEQIWGDGFDSELKDILGAQQDIARAIAEKLSVAFGTTPRARAVSPDAHRLVLQGRYFVARRWAGFDEAAKAFTEAAKIDPNFAPAHAGLAEVNLLHGVYIMADGHGPVDDKFGRSKLSARRAMELDPSLAEPHATLGLLLFMERQWDEAERHFQQTFRLNPNNGMAYHWHGLLLGVVGKIDRALEVLARSVDLDPLGHTSFFTYGGYLVAAGRYAESLAAMDHGMPIATPAATLPVYHSIRAVALHHLGRTEEAVATARLVRKLPRGTNHTPHWWADGDAIHVLHQAGHTREAEEYLREVQRNVGSASYLYGYALCALGRFKEGVPLLVTAEPICQSKLYFMPMFESLHGTPDFEAVFVRLKSSAEYKLAREIIVRLRRAEPKK